MAAILTGLQPASVLFIDEIHRLHRVVEEVLYSAMEDFFLSWMVGKGSSGRHPRRIRKLGADREDCPAGDRAGRPGPDGYRPSSLARRFGQSKHGG